MASPPVVHQPATSKEFWAHRKFPSKGLDAALTHASKPAKEIWLKAHYWEKEGGQSRGLTGMAWSEKMTGYQAKGIIFYLSLIFRLHFILRFFSKWCNSCQFFKTIKEKKMTELDKTMGNLSLVLSLQFPNAHSIFFIPPPFFMPAYSSRSCLRSFNISHWLHSQFTPEIAWLVGSREWRWMAALLSLWGAQTAAHQPATMGALRPAIIWLNAWDLRLRIITVQPHNQPTPHWQSDQLKQHCGWDLNSVSEDILRSLFYPGTVTNRTQFQAHLQQQVFNID